MPAAVPSPSVPSDAPDRARGGSGGAWRTLPRAVELGVLALGVNAVMTQLALMREMLGAFHGNELVLGLLLGNWLLLTGLGTGLGRAARWRRQPVLWLSLGQVLVAALPPLLVILVRLLRNVVFLRGTELGVVASFVSSFAVLLPYGLVSGALLTLSCTALEASAGPATVRRVYVADAVGSVLGGLAFTFALVPWLDHVALLCVPAILNLGAAGWLATRRDATRAPHGSGPASRDAPVLPRGLRRGLTGLAGAVGAALAWAVASGLEARLTPLEFPGQRVVYRGQSPYGRLVVTETAGQLNFLEHGVPVLVSPAWEQAEETVHYALAQRPDARRVLIVGGALAGNPQEALRHPVREITVVEPDPQFLAAGERLLPGRLADPRVQVVTTDGRRFIRTTDRRFEVVILDVPAPSTAQWNRYYTLEFLREVRRVLVPGGVVAFPLGSYANYVSPELARLLASARRTAASVFARVQVLPGRRVWFLASDGPLHLDIAARLEAGGIATRWVNRHALEAMFSADRLADLERAVREPAAVNRDFAPVLYDYHLRHWLSRFGDRSSVWLWLLTGGLAVGLIRLPAVPRVVWAGGFAGAALEFVLLLAFQIVQGALYRQVGLLVTLFMAGLGLGAGLSRRIERARAPAVLAQLALALGVVAAALPWALPALSAWPGAAATIVGYGVIPGLTLGVGLLVGGQFPLACAVQGIDAGRAAARMYGADFVGAFLGAVLASAWLVPVLGVGAACGVTAALNAIAAGCLWRQTRRA